MESNDLSGMIGSLLSDPKAMESIRQMAETLKGGGGSAETAEGASAGTETSPKGEGKSEESEKANAKEAAALSSPKNGSRKGKTNELTALLTAVKPFLSKEKCKAVDDAIGILRLISLSGQTDLLRSLSGLLR